MVEARKPLDDGSDNPEQALILAARRAALEVRPESAPTEATPDDSATIRLDVPSDAIPGYELLREIHRGGQGVVYQAMQKSTNRKVAIKVLREGPFAGARDRVRFEREIHILGHLSHSNIVSIHDSGSAAGSFYYVMDYISGQSLDRYLSKHQPPLRERLALFAKIAEAVGAAHLRGVIHRDLKPGNISVDSDGEPHILDFGLAKVAVPGTTDGEAMSITGQFIGSLPWASPEQAEGDPERIDVRTDVYSLGVVLYHMLTGRFPYRVVGPMHDILGEILHAQPKRPSATTREVDDELDTIALKCLEKDREQRYQSAVELARDVRRYLEGEAIEAKRGDTTYVLRKLLRRYRGRVAAAMVLLVALIAVSITTTVLYRRSVVAEHKAERISGLLEDILEQADPDNPRGADVTVREVIDDAARAVERELTDEPEVEAAIRHRLGKTYFNLGLLTPAGDHLRLALEKRKSLFGDDALETAESRDAWAVWLLESNRADEAGVEARRSLAVRRDHLGEGLIVAESLQTLAQVLIDRNEFDEAELLLQEAYAIHQAREHTHDPDHTLLLNLFGRLHKEQGERADDPQLRAEHYYEAEDYYRKSLALREELYGPSHARCATAHNNLAAVLRAQRRLAEAEPHYRQALDVLRATLGENHRNMAIVTRNYALLLWRLERYDEAEAAARESLRVESTIPDNSPWRRAAALYVLASILVDAGRAAEALPIVDECVAIRAAVRPDHWSTADARSLRGAALAATDPDQAEPLLTDNWALIHKELGDSHEKTVTALRRIIRFYEDMNELDEAERYRAMLPAEGTVPEEE
jgi:tetratricopeptide (TPR) repeat protein